MNASATHDRQSSSRWAAAERCGVRGHAGHLPAGQYNQVDVQPSTDGRRSALSAKWWETPPKIDSRRRLLNRGLSERMLAATVLTRSGDRSLREGRGQHRWTLHFCRVCWSSGELAVRCLTAGGNRLTLGVCTMSIARRAQVEEAIQIRAFHTLGRELRQANPTGPRHDPHFIREQACTDRPIRTNSARPERSRTRTSATIAGNSLNSVG